MKLLFVHYFDRVWHNVPVSPAVLCVCSDFRRIWYKNEKLKTHQSIYTAKNRDFDTRFFIFRYQNPCLGEF